MVAEAGVDSRYWAHALGGGSEYTVRNGIRHDTPSVKWTGYKVSTSYEMRRSTTIRHVPSPGNTAAGGFSVYGQVDIPNYLPDGTAMWDYKFEVFRVNSDKHPCLYNMLPE